MQNSPAFPVFVTTRYGVVLKKLLTSPRTRREPLVRTAQNLAPHSLYS